MASVFVRSLFKIRPALRTSCSSVEFVQKSLGAGGYEMRLNAESALAGLMPEAFAVGSQKYQPAGQAEPDHARFGNGKDGTGNRIDIGR